MKTKSKKILDNKGIALASVMVVLTVCLLIATIVLEITYTSLLSRKVYNKANDITYTSEKSVDDIQSVLQSIAAKSIVDMGASNDGFIDIATSNLLKSAGIATTDINKLSDTDRTLLANYIFDNLDYDNKKALGKVVVDESGNPVLDDQNRKKYERDPELFSVEAVKHQEQNKDGKISALAVSVHLTYTDSKSGFVSNISTDLVLNDITDRGQATDYELGSYTTFTGGGVKFTSNSDNFGNNKQSVLLQTGNVYIGMRGDIPPQAMEVDHIVTAFDSGYVEINGDIEIKNHSSVNFIGEWDEKEKKYKGGKVNIKGKIYLYKDSTLVVGEGVNLMCQDIVLVDGASQTSVSKTGTSYLAYNNGGGYSGAFPFKATNFEELKKTCAGKSTDTVGLVDDYKSQNTTGCILFLHGNQTDVVKRSGTSWKYAKSNTDCPMKVFFNPLYMPEARTTIKATDLEGNVSIETVDPELNRFVDTELLYLQYQFKTGSYLSTKNNATVLTGTELVKKSVNMPTGEDGKKEYYAASADKPARTTTSCTITTPLKYSDANQSYSTYEAYLCGDTTAAGGIIHDGNAVFGCSWDKYLVKSDKGEGYVGLCISNKFVTYEINGETVCAGRSLLDTMDTKTINDPNLSPQQRKELVEKTDAYKFLDEISYFTTLKASPSIGDGTPKFASNDDLYIYGMPTNLFPQGMTSLLDKTNEDGGPGGVIIKEAGMYDFITVENWTQN